MAKITSTQRAQLEAAGFSVGKSGNTVQNKDGKTVGGFNVNGNIFSGNDKVAGILRAKPSVSTKSPERASTAPTRRQATPTPKNTAPASSQRPKARTEASKKTYPKSPISKTPASAYIPAAPAPSPMAGVTKDEWKAMSRSERKEKGLPVRPIDAWTARGDWKSTGPEVGGPRQTTNAKPASAPNVTNIAGAGRVKRGYKKGGMVKCSKG